MKVNIVIMGQSGNGKSTIVNALMGKYVAKTGKGAAVTHENQVYSTPYKIGSTSLELNLYDTVGIELSEKVTQSTLNEIEAYLQRTKQKSSVGDVNLVWFCINNRSSRFQDFEVDLIRKLSYEYEIPFIIVLTQCIDNRVGKLEQTIHADLPEVVTARILAEDYRLRGGTVIPAYGLDDLLKLSVFNFDMLKTDILESKLYAIQQQLSVSEWQISEYERKANLCIQKHTESATKIGWLPVGCIPFVHSICIKMVAELHQIYGMPSGEKFAENIFVNVVVGLIVTPMMAIPLLSAAVAGAYVKTAGEEYCKVLSDVVKESKYGELQDQQLMAERIKQQLNKK